MVSIRLLIFALCLRITLTDRHNILLILADDLRANLGCYGGLAFTPNIDALAQSDGSWRFTAVYAQQALCGPSRTSFLTSRRPDTLGVFNNVQQYWRTLNGNYSTMPEWFRDTAGYTTHSIGKVFHPSHLSGDLDDHIYSWSSLPYHPTAQNHKNDKVCKTPKAGLQTCIVCPVNVTVQPEATLPDIQSASEAVKRLKLLANQPEPYLLAVGFHKPHIPLKYPYHFDELYPLDKIQVSDDSYKSSTLPPIAWNPYTDIRMRYDINQLNMSLPYGRMPDYYQKKVIRSYLSATSYMDELVGEVLLTARSLPTWNNTVVVFASDHGWSLGDHGEWSKFSNYQIATRVPFIIHLPFSSQPARKADIHAELLDLFPTLVDLSRPGHEIQTCNSTKQLACTDGKSLTPYMMKPLIPQCDVSITQYPRPSLTPGNYSDQPYIYLIKYMGYSLVTSQFRYTRWVTFDWKARASDWSRSSTVGEEFYNTTVDSREDFNMIDKITRIELCAILDELVTKCKIERPNLYPLLRNIAPC